MTSEPGWRIVVPVKPAGTAKSRLTAPPAVDHDALARALAKDTVAAVLGLPGVRCLVVTRDAEVATWAAAHGAGVVADPGGGLAGAVRAGLASASPPGVGGRQAAGPTAVLLGDLPALRTEDLAVALEACAAVGAGYVPDHLGSGTVLLGAVEAARLAPSFGPGSAARHARSAVAVGEHLTRLRLDVDTRADLEAAAALGLGVHTLRALAGDAPVAG